MEGGREGGVTYQGAAASRSGVRVILVCQTLQWQFEGGAPG